MYENEYWCDGKDCVAQGFADMVVSVKCDNTLKGIEKLLAGTFLTGDGKLANVYLKMSRCPTSTAPLGVEVVIDGATASPKALLKDDYAKVTQMVNEFKANATSRNVIRGY